MDGIQGIRDEVWNDRSGTLQQPLLINIVPGKCGKGHVFIVKILDLFYEMVRYKPGTNKATAKCSFTMRVKNTSGLDPVENSEDYWSKSSWEILPTPQPKEHSCPGLENCSEWEGTRLMRAAVRRAHNDGIRTSSH